MQKKKQQSSEELYGELGNKDQFNILYGIDYLIHCLPRSHEIVSIEEAPNEALTP
jgi:hypothetical protein